MDSKEQKVCECCNHYPSDGARYNDQGKLTLALISDVDLKRRGGRVMGFCTKCGLQIPKDTREMACLI